MGLARTLKKYQSFIKMSSDFNFTVTSWFLGNVHIKSYLNKQCLPPPLIIRLSYGPETIRLKSDHRLTRRYPPPPSPSVLLQLLLLQAAKTPFKKNFTKAHIVNVETTLILNSCENMPTRCYRTHSSRFKHSFDQATAWVRTWSARRRRKTLTKNLLPHSKGAISQLLLISATILAKAFKATMCGTFFF